MLFRFKILPTEKESSFIGMFGDVVKLRIKSEELRVLLDKNFVDKQQKFTKKIKSDFSIFLAKELCIPVDLIEIKKFNIHKSLIEAELPENAYEIIMSWIE